MTERQHVQIKEPIVLSNHIFHLYLNSICRNAAVWAEGRKYCIDSDGLTGKHCDNRWISPLCVYEKWFLLNPECKYWILLIYKRDNALQSTSILMDILPIREYIFEWGVSDERKNTTAEIDDVHSHECVFYMFESGRGDGNLVEHKQTWTCI